MPLAAGVAMVMDEMADQRVVLRLEGTFDAAESWRLHATLTSLEPGTRVMVDFSQVQRFHDFAIALLAQDLSSLDGRIAARGLSQHQLRILRYFGIDTDQLDDFAQETEAAAAVN